MISVEQALSLVKSNDHIVSALAPAGRRRFLGSLHTIADRVKNVTVTSCLPMGNFEYMTNRAYADSFNVDLVVFHSRAEKKPCQTATSVTCRSSFPRRH